MCAETKTEKKPKAKKKANPAEETDESTKEEAWAFIKKFDEPGARTFISMEHDREAGEKILNLAKKFDEKTALAIFVKYGEILDAAEKTKVYIQEKFKNTELAAQDVEKITDNITREAKDLLLNFLADEDKTPHEIIEDLNEIKENVLLSANAFRIMSERYGVTLEEMKGVSIEHKDSADLSDKEKEEMVRIFIANRRNNPKAYPKAWLAKREEEFRELIQTPGKRFYLCFDEGNLLSFAHSEPGKEGRTYVGSVNTNPIARRKKVGSAFFQTVLEKEEEINPDKPVEIVVNAQNTMFHHYIIDFGFEVVTRMEKGGLPYAEMVRRPQQRKKVA